MVSLTPTNRTYFFDPDYLRIAFLSIFRTQACWNCGRKATETCSGCNIARYCGSFCQHKDWESHHKICGSGATGRQPGGGTAGSRRSQNSRSPTPTAGQLEPPKQEAANDEATSNANGNDGDGMSKSGSSTQLAAELAKHETASETE